MTQLTLKLPRPKTPKHTSTFVPEQHYVNGNPELYWKQPISKPISNTWWRAYYAYTMRHINRRPGMNL